MAIIKVKKHNVSSGLNFCKLKMSDYLMEIKNFKSITTASLKYFKLHFYIKYVYFST